MGSQMGKTDGVLLNVLGWKLDDDPQPCMYVGPTEKNVTSMSNDRFTAMLESTPTLKDALARGHRNKTTEKFINGIRLGFAWAGSATELASHPNALVAIDETDRMEATKEGDVNEVLEPRMATYDGVIINTSTPLEGRVIREDDSETGLDHWAVAEKEDIHSPVWRLWQEGSRHEWAVPCVHCFRYFIPWSGLLVFDEEDTPAHVFSSTAIACPNCGAVLEYKSMEWMCSKGIFVAPRQKVLDYDGGDTAMLSDLAWGFGFEAVAFGSYLEGEEIRNLSFWVSGLCSTWRSFGHRTRAIVRSRQSGDAKREQAAVNTGLGELYAHRGESPAWNHALQLRTSYKRGDVPNDVMVITAAADVHRARINFVVRGWGPEYGSWLLDYGALYGDTRYAHADVWGQLAEVLDHNYSGLSIALMLVDSGYNPASEKYKSSEDRQNPAEASPVYQFCYGRQRARPSKGWDSRNTPHGASMISVDVGGTVVKDGLQLWHIDTGYYKSWIYERVMFDVARTGAWHLPEDVSEDYCKQLLSEARKPLDSGRAVWERVYKDNHYLDCEVGAVSAAHILRLHRLRADTVVHKRQSPHEVSGSGQSIIQKPRGRTVHRGLAS